MIGSIVKTMTELCGQHFAPSEGHFMSPSPEAANVGKAVAARVGTNIREVRTKLGMTQAQLAAPEFSISCISAIERGKIRPSLKALSVLKRLDVPLTFLLEGFPSGAAEARAMGYSPADSGPDQRIDVDLLQGNVLFQQGTFRKAVQLTNPIQPERITTDQVYRLYLLGGQINDSVFSLSVFSDLANDYFRLRDIDAVAYYHHSLKIFDALNRDSKNSAQKYMEISLNYKMAGKLSMAREYALRSLALYEMRDEQRLVGLTHQRLDKTLEKQNELDEAEYRRAIAIEQELNDTVAVSTCHASLAELLLKRGGTAEAEEEALTFARNSGDVQSQGQALFTLTRLKHQTGDYEAEDELFTQTLTLPDSSHEHEITAGAYFRFANLLGERGAVHRSLNAIKKECCNVIITP